MPPRIPPQTDLHAVVDSPDFDSLKERTQKVVEQLGFDGFMYVMVPREDAMAAAPRAFFMGTYDPDYLRLYEAQQWFRADPAAQRMLHTDLPHVWRSADFDTPQARPVLAAARRYGVGAGAIFPVVSSSLSMAGLGIAKDADPDAEYLSTQLILPYGQLLSIYLHAAVHRLLQLQPAPALKSISQRERECLQMAAQGMRDADIAAVLRITVRTVISHLNNARTKLQADNRAQMVARAMALKLIGL